MTSFISIPGNELAEATTKEADDKLLHDIPGISTLANDGFHFNLCIKWESELLSCFQREFKDPPPAW